MKKPTPKPSYKRATITTDGQYFYVEGKNVTRCASLWSACRAAVRAHRTWIDKQPGGRYDKGVKITLPDGRWRMGYLCMFNEAVILQPIQGKRK